MLLLDKLHRILRSRIVIGGGRSHVRVVGGRRVHFYDLPGRGSGPTLVLVHGLGASGNSYAPVLFGLRRTFRRILAPDLPGHGFSPIEPGETPLDARGHFEATRDFVREVAGEPVVLVGNSLGGAISAIMAIEEPSLVRGLVLLSPAGAPLGDEGLGALRAGFAVRSGREAIAHLGRMLHRRSYGTWLVANDLREHFTSPVIHKVLSSALPAESVDADRLAALTIPITFVWGESDRLLPGTGLDFYTRHLPAHARRELFRACGHLPQIEQPRRTVEVIEALAAELEAAERSAPNAVIAAGSATPRI